MPTFPVQTIPFFAGLFLVFVAIIGGDVSAPIPVHELTEPAARVSLFAFGSVLMPASFFFTIDEDGPRFRPVGPWHVTAVALGASGAAVAVLTLAFAQQVTPRLPPTEGVPNVYGMRYEDARSQLEKAGYVVALPNDARDVDGVAVDIITLGSSTRTGAGRPAAAMTSPSGSPPMVGASRPARRCW